MPVSKSSSRSTAEDTAEALRAVARETLGWSNVVASCTRTADVGALCWATQARVGGLHSNSAHTQIALIFRRNTHANWV